MSQISIEQGQAATVLVVEDEPMQRMDFIDIAEDAGFEVLDAYDADHAIALLETGVSVSLMLTDINMPGSMDGLMLAATVHRRWPPISIIITTAGHPPSVKEMPEGAIFCSKPLHGARVIETMHRLIA